MSGPDGDQRQPETVRWLTRAELERRQAAGDPPRAEVVVRTPETGGDTGGVAVLRLYDVIDSWGGWWGISASEVADALDAIPAGVTQVDVHINSPGGEAREGITIANLLRQHPTKVVTIVDGLAASAASMIAVAGDEVVMAPSSQLMVHDASGGAWGPAAWVRKAADMLDHLSDRYAEAYAGKAGGTTAEWRARMVEETWYSPQEAMDAGLADRLLTADDPPATGPGSTTESDVPDLETEEDDPLLARARAGLVKTATARHPKSPAAKAAGRVTNQRGAGMDPAQIREALGLAADTSDEDVVAAAAEFKEAAARAQTAKDKEPATGGDIPQAALAEVTRLSTEVAELRAAASKREKDERFAAWLRDGKTSPAEMNGKDGKDGLLDMYDAAPAQTVALVDARAAGSVMPVAAIGHDGPGATEDGALSDDQLAQLASLAGLPKEALRG